MSAEARLQSLQAELQNFYLQAQDYRSGVERLLTQIDLLRESKLVPLNESLQVPETCSITDREVKDARHQLYWSRQLSKALQEQRFELWLQPIVCLSSGEAIYQEVLLRLRDSSGRLLLPGQFVEAAERCGLMSHLDRFVIRKSIALLAATPAMQLSVNLSVRTLAEPRLAHWVGQVLTEAGVAPARLRFEVPEAALSLRGCRSLARVQALGCSFAVDECSGPATVARLQDLCVDQFKLSGNLLADDPEKMRLLHHSICGLGKQTVAKSVDTPGRLATVISLGIQYAQGYYLGWPSPEPSQGSR